MRLRETGVVCLVAVGVGGAATAVAYNVPPGPSKPAVSGPTTGTVTLRPSPNAPPVTLTPGSKIPNGAEIDTTNGTLTLTVSQQGKPRHVSITGGEFTYSQNRHTGRVVFGLALPLTGCPSSPTATQRRAIAASRTRHHPRRRGPQQRQITVTDSGGNFGTKGQFVATSTEGTRWRTTDTCSSTTVTVFSGRVIVVSLVTGRRITISAGQHYTVHK